MLLRAALAAASPAALSTLGSGSLRGGPTLAAMGRSRFGEGQGQPTQLAFEAEPQPTLQTGSLALSILAAGVDQPVGSPSNETHSTGSLGALHGAAASEDVAALRIDGAAVVNISASTDNLSPSIHPGSCIDPTLATDGPRHAAAHERHGNDLQDAALKGLPMIETSTFSALAQRGAGDMQQLQAGFRRGPCDLPHISAAVPAYDQEEEKSERPLQVRPCHLLSGSVLAS